MCELQVLWLTSFGSYKMSVSLRKHVLLLLLNVDKLEFMKGSETVGIRCLHHYSANDL